MDSLSAVTRGFCRLTSIDAVWKSAIDFPSQGDACESLTTNINIKVLERSRNSHFCFVPRMEKYGKRDVIKTVKNSLHFGIRASGKVPELLSCSPSTFTSHSCPSPFTFLTEMFT